jgi:hypothetical protein
MNSALHFSEAQLCELWQQHTTLEDDPRDASNDLRVKFEGEDGLAQEMRVAPDPVEADRDDHPEAETVWARYGRTRPTLESAWSQWTRLD